MLSYGRLSLAARAEFVEATVCRRFYTIGPYVLRHNAMTIIQKVEKYVILLNKIALSKTIYKSGF